MPTASEFIVLDTHTLLWWQAESERLSESAAERIARTDSCLISPITCWEVAMLVEKGRIELDRPTGAWISDLLAGSSVEVAPLTPAIAVSAAELPGFHGDPADRLIYATAATTGATLLSKDQRLHEYAARSGGVDVSW